MIIERNSYSIPIEGNFNKASIDSIGGKSYVVNQYVYDGDLSRNGDGWNIGVYADYKVELINGRIRATKVGDNPHAMNLNFNIDGHIIPCINGHRYLWTTMCKATWAKETMGYAGSIARPSPTIMTPNVDQFISYVFTHQSNTTTNLNIFHYNDYNKHATDGDWVEFWDEQFIDLTEWFGAEIAETINTAEDAYALGIPRTYIPYTTGTLVSADVDEVVSRGADTTELGSIEIPSAVRALEGYGESNGDDVNTVDFVNKVYHKKGYYDSTDTWVADVEDIDISSMLADDMSIEIESGGTVTFEQTDTEFPIYSSMTLLNLQPYINYQDIHISDVSLKEEYINDFNNGQYQDAFDIISDNEQLENKCSIAQTYNQIATILTQLQQGVS